MERKRGKGISHAYGKAHRAGGGRREHHLRGKDLLTYLLTGHCGAREHPMHLWPAYESLDTHSHECFCHRLESPPHASASGRGQGPTLWTQHVHASERALCEEEGLGKSVERELGGRRVRVFAQSAAMLTDSFAGWRTTYLRPITLKKSCGQRSDKNR